MEYIERISDKKIQKYLDIFDAVVVEGPKWCGKTRSCEQFSKSKLALADTRLGLQNQRLLLFDPASALSGESPRLIDEWQLVPECWDMVRSAVDNPQDQTKYLLTGSSTPRNDARKHSGAGRMGRIKMDTLSLQELNIANPIISLRDLLAGNARIEKPTSGKLSLDNIIDILIRGGWPAIVQKDSNSARIMVAEYYKAITGIEFVDFDNEQASDDSKIKWNPGKMDALFQSLARNIGTSTNNSTILKDIAEYATNTLSEHTLDQYLNVLKQLFLLIHIPAWHPTLKSNVRLRSAPKRILADPSIAIAALHATPTALKQDIKYVGNLFESLVLKDLIVYAKSIDADVYYYNDYNGLEVDAIVEGEDKNWGAIEIKLGYAGEEKGAANLLALEKKIATEKQKAPKFLAVICGIGSILHQRDDGVWIIPVDTLGA